MFDDPILIQPRSAGDALAWILRPSATLEGLGAVKVHRRAHLGGEFRVHTLEYRLFRLQGVCLGLRGLIRRAGLAYGVKMGLITSNSRFSSENVHLPDFPFFTVFSFDAMCSVGGGTLRMRK